MSLKWQRRYRSSITFLVSHDWQVDDNDNDIDISLEGEGAENVIVVRSNKSPRTELNSFETLKSAFNDLKTLGNVTQLI